MDIDTGNDDKDYDPLDDVWKSMKNALKYREQYDNFKTPLPPVFHVGGTYLLTRSISAGLMSRTVFWHKGVRQSFNASVNLQPYSFVSFSAGATWQVKGNVYLGGGFTTIIPVFGPLQFFLFLDNVPVYFSSLKIDDNDKIPYIPYRAKSFTVRTGLNLVFGKNGYVNKPMLNKGNSSWN